MPLFRATGKRVGMKAQPGRRWMRECRGSYRKTDEDGCVLSLTRLCLLSLADNMKEVWAKDYANNYLDHYTFRHIMGPFNLMPGELVEELIRLLCTRRQLSQAALHLLLVPQLRSLSLDSSPGLVTSALCGHIAARCQGLWSLDLSGAQQVPPKVLSKTLYSLPTLRSLSLAGMHCDQCVIRTIAHRCRFLRHLDVSRCHLLSPAALLPLGGGAFWVSSGSQSGSFQCMSKSQSSVSSSCSDPSTSLSPLPLTSLLALDIGFGEKEEDPVAAAAYMLLCLPCLERFAMESLAQACCIIEQRQFGQTNEFADREGVPRLDEVCAERRCRQSMDMWGKKREAEASANKEDDDDDDDDDDEEEEEDSILYEGYRSDIEEDPNRGDGPNCSKNQVDEIRRGVLSQSSEEGLILSLKDVRGVKCDFLGSLGHLCPNIYSISMNIDGHEDTRATSQESLIAAGLQTWAGQLRSLSVHFPGPLGGLLPALQVVGSSLVSLTLEGVKTSTHTPLMEVIKACARLRELVICAEPPTTQEEEEDVEDQQDNRDLPKLPNLCSLRLNFSYEHNQMKPVMSWMALKKVLKCLLTGSPSLEKLSLVSLPCPLDCVLQDVLQVIDLDLDLIADFTALPPLPLGRVKHISLLRTDVKVNTVKNIMQRSNRLKFLDVSYCWQISHLEWLNCKRISKVQVVWV